MALFAGIGTALKTSAMARWIAGGAAALVTALTWLALHDGHAHGVLADDPVHAYHRITPGPGHTGQQHKRT